MSDIIIFDKDFNLGEFIKAQRLDKDYSQCYLADRLDITRAHITTLEKNRVSISLKLWLKVLNLLDFDLVIKGECVKIERIGTILKTVRNELNYSQQHVEDISKELGHRISRNHIASIETRSTRSISLKVLFLLAEIYRLDMKIVRRS